MITMTIFEMIMLLFLIIGTGILFVVMSIQNAQIEERRQMSYKNVSNLADLVEFS